MDMPIHLRGQLIFRDHGSMNQASSPNYLTHSEGHPAGTELQRVLIAMGVIEAPKGLFLDDHMHGMSIIRGANLLSMEVQGHPSRNGYGDDFSSYDMKSLLTENIWRRPAADFGGIAGDLLFRANRIPPAPSGGQSHDRECLTVFGLITAHQSVAPKSDHMFMMSGMRNAHGLAFTIIDRGPEPLLVNQKDRSVVTSPLEMPLWGFGSDKYGLVSTLRLDVLDALDELRALDMKDVRTSHTAAEKKRMEELDRFTGGIMHVSRKDERFRQFTRLMMEAGVPSSSLPRTAEVQAEVNRISTEAIRKILEAEEDGPRGPKP